ncbi:MAG: hypothetical protein AAB209_12510, partial [Bacteroidota bacterium]
HLYQAVLSAFLHRVHPDKELMRKTAELVKHHVKVGQIAEPLPIYEINEKTLEALKKDGKSDKTKVINLRKSITVFIDENGGTNPYLIGIGERLEAINELYDQRQLDTIEALKKMEDLIKEINLAKKEQAEKNLDTRTFSIYWILKARYVASAEPMAKKIDELLTKYPNWNVNAEEKRDLRLGLYAQMLKPIGKERIQEVIEKILDVAKR